jgi:hypothetical protein
MVSALAGSVAGGALLMALFAMGTAITMVVGPWLWLRFVTNRAKLISNVPADVIPAGRANSSLEAAPLVFYPTVSSTGLAPTSTAAKGDWGVRLAGAALASSAAWALWMGLVHETAPWCVVP